MVADFSRFNRKESISVFTRIKDDIILTIFLSISMNVARLARFHENHEMSAAVFVTHAIF